MVAFAFPQEMMLSLFLFLGSLVHNILKEASCLGQPAYFTCRSNND